MVNTDVEKSGLIAALVSVQVPLVSVTQLAVPPGTKLPLTVAFAMAVLEPTSRTVAVARARQFLPFLLQVPVNDLTATTAGAGAVGVPVARE